jgi:hypothetical protein
MAYQEEVPEIRGFQEPIDVLGVSPDLLLSLASGLSVTGELDDDGMKLLFKKTLLKNPG